MAETLPEGTDQIIPGSSSTAPDRGFENTITADAGGKREKLKAAASDLRDKVSTQTGEYRAQATDKARDFAAQGKDKASGALDEVARLIGDNATQIDDKVGSQYGDYARKAAEAVSGAAETLRGKDVDELLEDARNVIRQSPALAIGAAAAAGFFLARVIKSGSESLAESARMPVTTASTKPRKSPGAPANNA